MEPLCSQCTETDERTDAGPPDAQIFMACVRSTYQAVHPRLQTTFDESRNKLTTGTAKEALSPNFSLYISLRLSCPIQKATFQPLARAFRRIEIARNTEFFKMWSADNNWRTKNRHKRNHILTLNCAVRQGARGVSHPRSRSRGAGSVHGCSVHRPSPALQTCKAKTTAGRKYRRSGRRGGDGGI